MRNLLQARTGLGSRGWDRQTPGTNKSLDHTATEERILGSFPQDPDKTLEESPETAHQYPQPRPASTGNPEIEEDLRKELQKRPRPEDLEKLTKRKHKRLLRESQDIRNRAIQDASLKERFEEARIKLAEANQVSSEKEKESSRGGSPRRKSKQHQEKDISSSYLEAQLLKAEIASGTTTS